MEERRLLEPVSVTEGAWNLILHKFRNGGKRTFVGPQDIHDRAQPCEARGFHQISTCRTSCSCVAGQRRVRRRAGGGDDMGRHLPMFGPEANCTVLGATLDTVG